MIDTELGFTSDVIKDPGRFVGRTSLIRDCIRALNTPLGLIAVYGKRGVGKSSLLRQIQNMALGDYTLAHNAGLKREVPKRPRTYLTVYYACDALISDATELLNRLITDQNDEDGLLRLVPNDGKELVEFQRTKEVHLGADLKVVNWGAKGIEASKYVRVVEDSPVQTFRNFISSIVTHQVRKFMGRDALLILLDEFDVIRNKEGIGSLIKSLSGPEVKFGICGIGHDLSDLVADHASVERLLEEGALHVEPMQPHESKEIIYTAESLFKHQLSFERTVVSKIAEISHGYPYFTQLIGRACVNKANILNVTLISQAVFDMVLEDIKTGDAIPTLERQYQRAIGQSRDRQTLLHFLADQPEDSAEVGQVFLKEARKDLDDLNIQHLDQLLPRLVEHKYGPVLRRDPIRQGVYEFVNPVLRLYVQLRRF